MTESMCWPSTRRLIPAIYTARMAAWPLAIIDLGQPGRPDAG
ncbi:MAG: hypothetical protein U1F68_20430 [Gammaproteobacteria bacterium]